MSLEQMIHECDDRQALTEARSLIHKAIYALIDGKDHTLILAQAQLVLAKSKNNRKAA